MNDEIAYQFKRNENEVVYAQFKEFRQRRYIDLRVYYKSSDDNEMRPTKKGITLGIEFLKDLHNSLAAIEERLRGKAAGALQPPRTALQK